MNFFFYTVLLYDLTEFSNVCKIDNIKKKKYFEINVSKNLYRKNLFVLIGL